MGSAEEAGLVSWDLVGDVEARNVRKISISRCISAFLMLESGRGSVRKSAITTYVRAFIRWKFDEN